MLDAHFVPRTDNAPFQRREPILDGVGMNVAHDVGFSVLNPAVFPLVSRPDSRNVGGKLIANNHLHVFADVPPHGSADGRAGKVGHHDHTKSAAALGDSHDHGLVFSTAGAN